MIKPNYFPSANHVFHLKQKAEYLDLKFHVWNFSQFTNFTFGSFDKFSPDEIGTIVSPSP